MIAGLFKCFAVFGSLLTVVGCRVEPFEICKKKNADGTLSESCTSEVRNDGSCEDGFVKVKSEEYKYPSCTMEL